jgi:(E)-4-hydroxy-3-methylbut-2-enyl-diphosphate synthase
MHEFQDRGTELELVEPLGVSSEVIGLQARAVLAVTESAAHLSPGDRRSLIPITVLRSATSPMEESSYQDEDAITRRHTTTTWVGSVPVGSEHPIVVQSMTNTDTKNVRATVDQIAKLVEAGSEMVRVTVNNRKAAAAVPEIVSKLGNLGISVPIIGDFHFIGDKLLLGNRECAEVLAKYRINPGNTGHRNDDAAFRSIVETAITYDKPVRIGVNWGSLDPQMVARMMDENKELPHPRSARAVKIDAMVRSAMDSAELAERVGLPHDKIILSTKISRPRDVIKVNRMLAGLSDYPLHLGLTEAGMGDKAIAASTAALSPLLEQGIGDTIRVSLTPGADGDRTKEVRIARQILQSLEIRQFTPEITSCPGCGRTATDSNFYLELAGSVEEYIDEQGPEWAELYPGSEALRIGVMGCVVNGPGESKDAHVGISLPGAGENPKAPVYIDGELHCTLEGDDIIDQFKGILGNYVKKRWG